MAHCRYSRAQRQLSFEGLQSGQTPTACHFRTTVLLALGIALQGFRPTTTFRYCVETVCFAQAASAKTRGIATEHVQLMSRYQATSSSNTYSVTVRQQAPPIALVSLRETYLENSTFIPNLIFAVDVYDNANFYHARGFL